MLLIADSCHFCFSCHLQTVHPIPVIFISISTEIISSFQWHAWYAKLLPWSSFSFHCYLLHSKCYHAVNRRFVSFLFFLPFANRASDSGDLYIDFDRNHLIFPVACLVCQVTAMIIIFLPEHAYTCCILSAILLFIADSCHSCFACHLQTVHPIPVIFISISTEIISSFQWHAWFAKLLPCSSFSFRSTHMHRISYLAYHTCFASCCLRISRCWLWFRLLVFLSWVEPGDEFVNEERYLAVYRRFVSFLFCLPFANRASDSGDLYIDFDRNHLIFPVACLVCQVTAMFIIFLPEHAYASHIISCISYMFCIMLLAHFSLLIVVPFACVLVLGRAGRRVRERGTCWVRLRGSSFRQLWEPCRQDDHTFEIISIFAC